jgi:hypothetical protein
MVYLSESSWLNCRKVRQIVYLFDHKIINMQMSRMNIKINKGMPFTSAIKKNQPTVGF